jgi:hypothetical protein
MIFLYCHILQQKKPSKMNRLLAKVTTIGSKFLA